MKLNKSIKVTENEALEVLKKGFPYYVADEFAIMFCVEDTDLPKDTMKNISFDLEKVGRKGRVLKIEGHPDGGVKAEKGIYKVTATWDFIHPTNFAQNQNNVQKEFKVYV